MLASRAALQTRMVAIGERSDDKPTWVEASAER